MLEFIGGCVVVCVIGYIILRVLNFTTNFAVARNNLEGVKIAVLQEVPYSFAIIAVKNRNMMLSVLKTLKANYPNFKTMKPDERVGIALKVMYEGAKAESNVDYYADDTDGVKSFTDSLQLAIALGVPANMYEAIYTKNHETANEFAWKISEKGEPHEHSTFEVRIAIAVHMLYKLHLKNPGAVNV